MCFNERVSLITSISLYSSIIYSIKKQYHQDRYFLYIILCAISTSGIIEPLEGIIHHKYKKSGKISKYLTNIVYLNLMCQPHITSLFAMVFKILTTKQKIILITLNSTLIYFQIKTKPNKIYIEPVEEKGYTKLAWKNMTYEQVTGNKEVIIFLLHIFVTILPLLMNIEKSKVCKITLIIQITIILISIAISQLGLHRLGSIWCLLSSINIFITIIILQHLP